MQYPLGVKSKELVLEDRTLILLSFKACPLSQAFTLEHHLQAISKRGNRAKNLSTKIRDSYYFHQTLIHNHIQAVSTWG